MAGKSKILLVEDNRSLRLDLTELLELHGYRVTSASDGSSALSSIASEQFDVVVSDYEMPQVNGYILLQTLRARPRTATLPFVMISGGNPPALDHDPYCRFLKKPFLIEELVAYIEHLVVQQQRNQRAFD